MRFISTTRTALGGPFATMTTMLGRHRALTRVSLAALAFTLVLPLSQNAATQASGERPRSMPESLLPATVGVAVATDATVTLPFGAPMDTASVEASLELEPAQPVTFEWNAEATELSISPRTRWLTDRTYLLAIAAGARRADGSEVGSASRFAFTTQAAPAVTSFQVDLAGSVATLPEERSSTTQMLDADPTSAAVRDARTAIRAADRTADLSVPDDVSAATAVEIGFSRPMDRSEVERHFALNPSAAGDVTWRGDTLVFVPSDRLAAGMRYTVSLAGARDLDGNPLGGQTSFSFVVRPGAQLAKTTPESGATDVTDVAALEMWFSQPMDADASAALIVADSESGEAIDGSTAWNEETTQLTFTPEAALAEGATIEVAFSEGAQDADGNPVAMEWSFRTREAAPQAAAATPAPTPQPAVAAPTPAPTPAPAPVIPPPAPASSAAEYAVNQINASRAAYGFGPVALDDTISAVAYAHAYDQAVNGYFSHYGLDGSTRESRLIAGGVSFGWSAENQCYLVGRSPEATLDWCHAQFMAEPYPGHWNHIANVLDPRAARVGVGIAQVGSKIVIVWDFTD